MEKKAFLARNPAMPCEAVIIDEKLCIGCNTCVDVCRSDVLQPVGLVIDEKTGKAKASGRPPVLVYPDECWFCGCCAGHCPKGAITVNIPLCQKVTWKNKDTNKLFRLGMKNPPAANRRPPAGGWNISRDG